MKIISNQYLTNNVIFSLKLLCNIIDIGHFEMLYKNRFWVI